jgi:hypothetical protein
MFLHSDDPSFLQNIDSIADFKEHGVTGVKLVRKKIPAKTQPTSDEGFMVELKADDPKGSALLTCTVNEIGDSMALTTEQLPSTYSGTSLLVQNGCFKRKI